MRFGSIVADELFADALDPNAFDAEGKLWLSAGLEPA